MGEQAIFYFTILLLPLCSGKKSESNADKRPTCDRCNPRLLCDCSCAGFDRVPMVTRDALTLDLSFNNITTVTDSDLTGHRRLRALSFHGNRITAIDPSAFNLLWNLEELNLSTNRLTTLDPEWFQHLGALLSLNLLDNPYRCIGGMPVFQGLVRLRRLAFGGAHLEEIQRVELSGVTELEMLTVHANQLRRYEPGALSYIWPLGGVALSLHGPFLRDNVLAAAVLADVSYPETPLMLKDLHTSGNESVQPMREMARRRVRNMEFRNLSVSDEAVVHLIEILSGIPITTFTLDGVTLNGEGRWEKASWADLSGIDELFVKDVLALEIWKFVSFLQMKFLLQYPRKISVINSKVFVVPCETTSLMVNLQYVDLSDNLLTDLTLTETMCNGNGTLSNLRVINISGNPLKSLSTLSRLVMKLHKLTHLSVSRTQYSSMPESCSWPKTLRHFNISGAKLTHTTSCLPSTLQVLDLSYNYLQSFTVAMPDLRELHLTGNRFLRLPAGVLFPNLQTLSMQSNIVNMFTHAELQTFPRLQNIQAGRNKFACSCEFVTFLQSGLRGDEEVHLTDGEDSYICDSPLYLQGEPVKQVHLSVLVCHRVLFVSVSCGVALLVGVLLSVLLWRLHAFWYLRMMWAWLRTKHGARRRRLREGGMSETLINFDAFVSYSEKDAGWVETVLVPELEEPSSESCKDSTQPLTLCLHKRDFLPGRWIEENIVNAMECSRRTVFVLSENFVRSNWCRYELDFSHFWVFEGGAGVESAILVLLEPLSKDDIPKRFCKLRKLMSSTTYLEWPQEEEKREEFWRCLRKALQPIGEEE